ncbi:MAG: hypothetical protein HWD92_00370 [Flavobacteriia bacterium]|nr:hypothetical protein [Flavobacteriia bacterium]
MDTTKFVRESAEIKTGHWIFAGLFVLAFIGYLIWAYKSDSATHKKFKIQGSTVLYAILLLLLIVFIFKGLII